MRNFFFLPQDRCLRTQLTQGKLSCSDAVTIVYKALLFVISTIILHVSAKRDRLKPLVTKAPFFFKEPTTKMSIFEFACQEHSLLQK